MGTSTDTAPEPAVVPPGRVTLTDRRTRRSWQVEVAAFRMAVHPVRQDTYAAVTGEWPAAARGAALPVESVSWWDAVRFCNALSARSGRTPAYVVRGEEADRDPAADGYRLPTEAEWEHACRAGTSGPRYGPLDDVAWYRGNSGERLHEVGTRRPNPWGLHDMLGNVWEWCWDHYDPEVYGTYRVLRGGGWFDEQWSCRTSVRRRSHPTLRLDDVGFRVVLDGDRDPDPADRAAAAGSRHETVICGLSGLTMPQRHGVSSDPRPHRP